MVLCSEILYNFFENGFDFKDKGDLEIYVDLVKKWFSGESLSLPIDARMIFLIKGGHKSPIFTEVTILQIISPEHLSENEKFRLTVLAVFIGDLVEFIFY